MLNTLGKSTWMILFSSNLTFNEYLRQEKVEYLENSVAQLSYDETNEYFKLHDCKCLPGKIKVMPEKATKPGQCSGSKKCAEGIFRTNNFALGPLTTGYS